MLRNAPIPSLQARSPAPLPILLIFPPFFKENHSYWDACPFLKDKLFLGNDTRISNFFPFSFRQMDTTYGKEILSEMFLPPLLISLFVFSMRENL